MMIEQLHADIRTLLVEQAKQTAQLQEQALQLIGLRDRLRLLDTAVRGNGDPGLRQRVSALEAASDIHVARIKRTGYVVVGICAAVSGLAGAVCGWLL